MSNTATTVTGGKHGTKWIGGIGIASAILSGIDPATLPPSWLPYFMGALSAVTLIRGVVNTANQSQPPQR